MKDLEIYVDDIRDENKFDLEKDEFETLYKLGIEGSLEGNERTVYYEFKPASGADDPLLLANMSNPET